MRGLSIPSTSYTRPPQPQTFPPFPALAFYKNNVESSDSARRRDGGDGVVRQALLLTVPGEVLTAHAALSHMTLLSVQAFHVSRHMFQRRVLRIVALAAHRSRGDRVESTSSLTCTSRRKSARLCVRYPLFRAFTDINIMQSYSTSTIFS